MFAAAGISTFSRFSEFPRRCCKFPQFAHLLDVRNNLAEAIARRSSCWNSTVQGHRRNVVPSYVEDIFPIFGQMWLVTTGPFISVTVLFAQFV